MGTVPTSIQALLVVVFFILPGFIAVQVDARVRPIRERSVFDSTGWTVLYSTLVHAILAIPTTYLMKWYFGLDVGAPGFQWKDWGTHRVSDGLVATEAILGGYIIAMLLLGGVLGYLVSSRLRESVPVWTRETSARASLQGTLVALVKMTDGDVYTGTLYSVPTDYDILTRNDRDFSMIRVTLFPKDGPPEAFEEDEHVVINTENVASVHFAPAA